MNLYTSRKAPERALKASLQTEQRTSHSQDIIEKKTNEVIITETHNRTKNTNNKINHHIPFDNNFKY